MTGKARLFRRFSLYGLYEALLFAWLVYVWTHYEGIPLKQQFHDVEPIQQLQEAQIGIAAVLYLLLVAAAYRGKRMPEFHAYVLIAFGLLWTTNRELDGFWERHELDLVYDTLKFVTAIPAILFAARYPRLCCEGLAKIRTSRGFLFLLVALGGYVAAQIVSEILEALEVHRNYERATEESVELLVGSFFLFSAIESFLQTIGPQRRPYNSPE